MGCIFCDIVSGKGDCLKFYEDDLIIGIMDKYPFCDGHALLIPKIHYVVRSYIILAKLQKSTHQFLWKN